MRAYGSIVILLAISVVICAKPSADDRGADATPPENKLRRAQRYLSKSFSAKGAFRQDFICDGPETDAIFTGTFEVKRKGRYRFTYTEPPGKLLISDGNHSFLYDKINNVVIVDTLSDELPAAFSRLLLGEAADGFTVEELTGTEPNETDLSVFRLVPTSPHPVLRAVLLTLSDTPPYIRRISIVDGGGCIIRTTLQKIEIDTGIPGRRFQFTPPKSAILVTP